MSFLRIFRRIGRRLKNGESGHQEAFREEDPEAPG